jgi:hypothetical protein
MPKAGRLQCKDIPDQPILQFLHDQPVVGTSVSKDGLPFRRWTNWFWDPKGSYEPNPEYEYLPDNSVARAMPEGVCDKLRIAKMAMMIRRGIVDGCPCGCRGDFVITKKGEDLLAKMKEAECQT